jgi:HprK-related kinase A
MLLSQINDEEFLLRLGNDGLVIKTGPFVFRLVSELPHVGDSIRRLYANYMVFDSEEFAHYTVRLKHGPGIRRWVRQQVRFGYEGQFPFEPLPSTHAYPQLEWAMNWCISTQAHQYLILHAATVERNGKAVIMPAPSGSGKSTLCAALIHRGWRLISDELALISLVDQTVVPLVRPVSLKNNSISIIQSYVPESVMSSITLDTVKGSVAHMKVPDAHVANMSTPSTPAWIIFPKYVAGAAPQLGPISRAQTLVELARNSFNYALHGKIGFNVLSSLLEKCDCYSFEYSQLDEAISAFDNLVSPSETVTP